MPISEKEQAAINFLAKAHRAFPLGSHTDLRSNVEKAILDNAPPPLTNVPKELKPAVIKLIPLLDATIRDATDKTSFGTLKSVAKMVLQKQEYSDFVNKL